MILFTTLVFILVSMILSNLHLITLAEHMIITILALIFQAIHESR